MDFTGLDLGEDIDTGLPIASPHTAPDKHRLHIPQSINMGCRKRRRFDIFPARIHTACAVKSKLTLAVWTWNILFAVPIFFWKLESATKRVQEVFVMIKLCADSFWGPIVPNMEEQNTEWGGRRIAYKIWISPGHRDFEFWRGVGKCIAGEGFEPGTTPKSEISPHFKPTHPQRDISTVRHHPSCPSSYHRHRSCAMAVKGKKKEGENFWFKFKPSALPMHIMRTSRLMNVFWFSAVAWVRRYRENLWIRDFHGLVQKFRILGSDALEGVLELPCSNLDNGVLIPYVWFW